MRRLSRAPMLLVLALALCVGLMAGCLSKGSDDSAGASAESKAERSGEAPMEEAGAAYDGDEGEFGYANDDVASSEPMRERSSVSDLDAAKPASVPAMQKSKPTAEPPKQKKRLIVYEAWLRLGVDSVDAALRRAEELTATYGGYIESSTLTTRVLRIPSESYASALDALKELGEVCSIRQQSQDVTEAYTDLVARIDNLKALEARFETLLAEATTVADRLKIERELRRVRQELNVLEARRKVLANKAAFATIEFSVESRSDERVTRDRVQPFQFARGYGLQEVL